jgi:hypothetical protein
VKINELELNGPAKDEKQANDPVFAANRQDQIVTYHGQPAEYPQCVILVKQHGKYTVLYGDSIRDAVEEAYLVTSHTLKKVRYEQSQPATAERVLTSTTTGQMADKFQAAFRGSREPVSVKVQNAGVSGAHVGRDWAGHHRAQQDTLTSQVRGEKIEKNTTFGRHGSASDVQRGTHKSPQYHSGARRREQ